MKFSTLTLALSATVLAACSSSKPNLTPDTAPVVGTWHGTQSVLWTESGSVSSKPEFVVGTDSVTATNECFDGTKTVSVKAVSPAIVKAKTIFVTKTVVKSVASGDALCDARVDQGEYSYEIVGGKLTMTSKDGKVVVVGSKDPNAKPAAPAKTVESKDKEKDKGEGGYAPGFAFPPL